MGRNYGGKATRYPEDMGDSPVSGGPAQPVRSPRPTAGADDVASLGGIDRPSGRRRRGQVELFKSVERLALKRAWHFARCYGRDVRDFEGEARHATRKAIESWDPNRGALSTWSWMVITNHLHDYVAKVDAPQELPDPEEMVDLRETAHPAREFIFLDWVGSLSSEAQEVVRILTGAPGEILDLLGSEPPRKMRGRLKRGLRKMGWSWPRIWRTFHELREAVTQ